MVSVRLVSTSDSVLTYPESAGAGESFLLTHPFLLLPLALPLLTSRARFKETPADITRSTDCTACSPRGPAPRMPLRLALATIARVVIRPCGSRTPTTTRALRVPMGVGLERARFHLSLLVQRQLMGPAGVSRLQHLVFLLTAQNHSQFASFRFPGHRVKENCSGAAVKPWASRVAWSSARSVLLSKWRSVLRRSLDKILPRLNDVFPPVCRPFVERRRSRWGQKGGIELKRALHGVDGPPRTRPIKVRQALGYRSKRGFLDPAFIISRPSNPSLVQGIPVATTFTSPPLVRLRACAHNGRTAGRPPPTIQPSLGSASVFTSGAFIQWRVTRTHVGVRQRARRGVLSERSECRLASLRSARCARTPGMRCWRFSTTWAQCLPPGFFQPRHHR